MADFPRSSAADLLRPVAEAFSDALRTHGPVPAGVFWRNADGQRLRFQQLTGILGPEDWAGGLTINDLGCGYGALFEFLADLPCLARGAYYGYDISPDMIAAARQRITDPRARFVESARPLVVADYSFVSGTYNLKLGADDRTWLEYILSSLLDLAAMSRKGFAFNMLMPDHMRPRNGSLFHAPPLPFELFCRQRISPHVTVITGYPLAEWTMWVRL